MLEVLQYVLGDFWHWAGAVTLILAAGVAIGHMRG